MIYLKAIKIDLYHCLIKFNRWYTLFNIIMSNLDSWFQIRKKKSFFENLSKTRLQTIKDYLYSNITFIDVTIKYIININIQDPINKTIYILLAYLVILGYQIPNLYV